MKANFTNVIENEFTVTGLTEDQSYEFRVTAKNAAGVWSTPSESVTIIAQDVIEGPTAFIDPKFKSTSVVQAGETFIIDADYFGKPLPEVTWLKDGKEIDKVTPRMEVKNSLTHTTLIIRDCTRKPDHDGGSKIIYYVVEMQAKGDNTWTTCSEGKAHEVTVNGLAKGKEYLFRVSAVNEKGKSEPKSLLVPITVNDTSAQPIINLLSNIFSVKAGNDLKVDVPFKGVPPPTVEWKKDGNLLKETSRVNVYTSDTSSQLTIKDATRIDAGMYEVTVANSVGTTSIEIHINVFERPGPPSELNVDEVSADFISLSWQPPHYTGGCEISNYVVEKRDTGSTIWQAVSVSLSWDKPEYDGGAKITGYVVERKQHPDSCWLKCNFTNLLDTFLEVTGLEEGEQYDFRVIAKNSAELFSAPSETTGAVTVQHDVEPPKITMEDKFRQAVVVKAGELLRIDADISGRPNPTVFWLKNGRNICTKGRVEIIATKTHTSLLIRESVRKDSGQYTLTLQSTGGTTNRAVTCKVLDRKQKTTKTQKTKRQLCKDEVFSIVKFDEED
uniref:Titin n=1 Tax=Labrus bergylta TaxID=56723 RepID=A0A3Q3KVM8_9LABR